MKNFLLLFTFFSIVLPIGIQPQVQITEAFDESVINDNIDGMRDGDSGNGKANKNVETFVDPGSIDLISASIESAQIGTQSTNVNNKIVPNDESKVELSSHGSSSAQSSNKDYADSINSNENEYATNDLIVSDDKPGTELSPTDSQIGSTDSQIDTANSNVSDSANGQVNENEVIVPLYESTDESSSTVTTTSQSQSSEQPKYKSYRDYINSNANENFNNNIIESDDKPGTELSPTHTEIKSTNSQVNTANSNVNNSANGQVNENLTIPHNQSTPESTSNTSSQSQSSDRPMYESYRDYINSNTNVNKIENVIAPDHSNGESSSTESSHTVDMDSYVNENVIARDVQLSTESTSSVSTSSESQASAQSINKIYGDFNGDGFDDLALKVPLEDVDTGGGTMTDAGAVNVIYGSSNGLSATTPRPDQFWTQSTTDVNDLAEQGDAFGQSLSSGDFNGDGRDDLAIGVPYEDIDTGGGTVNGAGAVNVLYGSSSGLSATSPRPDQFWTQNNADVNDLAEEFDGFGFTLSSGDFNGDGRDDLVIGVPFEDIDTGAGTINGAGAVNVLYGSSSGLSATSPRPDQFWTRSTTDVNGLAEEFDSFGLSLSAGDFNGDGRDDLAIGVPFEDVDTGAGNINWAGAVNVLYGSSSGLSATSPRPDQLWTQSTTDVNDLAENNDGFGRALAAGDFNGDGIDDLAIGVPDEDVDTGGGTINGVGAVNVLYGSSNGLSATSPRPDQFWTQNSVDVNDLAEQGDGFGIILSSGDFNGDGRDDLAIGVPAEDVDTGAGTISNAGAVNVLYGSSNGLSATTPRPDQFWTQSTTDVNDLSEEFDNVGGSLSTGDFNGDGRDDLAIGVPYEDIDTGGGTINNAGAVNVLHGSSSGLSATSPRPDQFWTQNNADVNDIAEPFDSFSDSELE